MFFSLFPKTSISTILYIIKIWILENKNFAEIYNHIKEQSNEIVISKVKMDQILYKLRLIISHYYKDVYTLDKISQKNIYEHFAIDESDFVKINNKILWVIGIINTFSKKINLKVFLVELNKL